MNRLLTHLLARLRRYPAAQRWLRPVVAVGPVAALVADGPAGHRVPAVVVVVVVALSLAAGAVPESSALLLADLVVVSWWATGVHVDLGAAGPVAAVLVAAAGLLAAHVAAVLASYGPPSVLLERAVLRRWAVRTLGLSATAVVALVVTAGLDGDQGPRLLWPAALVAVAGLAVLLSQVLGADRDRA